MNDCMNGKDIVKLMIIIQSNKYIHTKYNKNLCVIINDSLDLILIFCLLNPHKQVDYIGYCFNKAHNIYTIYIQMKNN